jgi:hypothetical protein
MQVPRASYEVTELPPTADKVDADDRVAAALSQSVPLGSRHLSGE